MRRRRHRARQAARVPAAYPRNMLMSHAVGRDEWTVVTDSRSPLPHASCVLNLFRAASTRARAATRVSCMCEGKAMPLALGPVRDLTVCDEYTWSLHESPAPGKRE